MIGYFKLWKFSSKSDRAVMIAGCVSAFIYGLLAPSYGIVIGYIAGMYNRTGFDIADIKEAVANFAPLFLTLSCL